jgi:hypothetical protein
LLAGLFDPLTEAMGLFGSGRGEKYGKLISPNTGDDISLARYGSKNLGEML